MINDHHEPLVEVAAQLLVVLLDADIVPQASSLATAEEVGAVSISVFALADASS